MRGQDDCEHAGMLAGLPLAARLRLLEAGDRLLGRRRARDRGARPHAETLCQDAFLHVGSHRDVISHALRLSKGSERRGAVEMPAGSLDDIWLPLQRFRAEGVGVPVCPPCRPRPSPAAVLSGLPTLLLNGHMAYPKTPLEVAHSAREFRRKRTVPHCSLDGVQQGISVTGGEAEVILNGKTTTASLTSGVLSILRISALFGHVIERLALQHETQSILVRLEALDLRPLQGRARSFELAHCLLKRCSRRGLLHGLWSGTCDVCAPDGSICDTKRPADFRGRGMHLGRGKQAVPLPSFFFVEQPLMPLHRACELTRPVYNERLRAACGKHSGDVRLDVGCPSFMPAQPLADLVPLPRRILDFLRQALHILFVSLWTVGRHSGEWSLKLVLVVALWGIVHGLCAWDSLDDLRSPLAIAASHVSAGRMAMIRGI
mmetsp:Transcript_61726/g.172426  ORF Transcript_61726/g.172426 Transcript_61726/m.172426 type:complete len:431 (+) Transcript_61726:243-1535(+)